MGIQKLYDYAVALLAKRDYSSGELRSQLSRLAESDTVVSLREDSVHRYEEAALAKSQSLF